MSPEALQNGPSAVELAAPIGFERGEGINDDAGFEKYASLKGREAKQAALALREDLTWSCEQVQNLDEIDHSELNGALSKLSNMDREAVAIAQVAEEEISRTAHENMGETTANESNADNLTRNVQSGRVDPDISGDGTGAGAELASDVSIGTSNPIKEDEAPGNVNSADDASKNGQFRKKLRQDEPGTSVDDKFQADKHNEARGEPKPEETPKPARKDNPEKGIEEEGEDEKDENLRAIDDELNLLDGQYKDVARESQVHMRATSEHARAHGIDRFNTYLLKRSDLELKRQMIVQGADAPEARMQVTEEFIHNQQYTAAVDKANHQITSAEDALRRAKSSVKKYEEDLSYERSAVPKRAEAVKELKVQMDRDPNNEQLNRAYVNARRVYSETVSEIREMETKLRALQEEKIPGHQEQALLGREELERIKANPEQYSQVPDNMQNDLDYRRCVEKAGTWASQDSEAFERRMGYNQRAKALGHFKRACPDKFYFYRRREGFDESEDEYCDLQSQYRDTEKMSDEEVEELASHAKALIDRYNQLSQGDNVDRSAMIKVAKEDFDRYEKDIHKRQRREAEESKANVEDYLDESLSKQREAEMALGGSNGEGSRLAATNINKGDGNVDLGQNQLDAEYPDSNSRVDYSRRDRDSYQEGDTSEQTGLGEYRGADARQLDTNHQTVLHEPIQMPGELTSENAGNESSVDNLEITVESLGFFDAIADDLDIFSSHDIGIHEKIRAMSQRIQHLPLPIRINYNLNRKPVSINIIKSPADGGFAIEVTGYGFGNDEFNDWRIDRDGELLETDTSRERQLNEILNQLTMLGKKRLLQSVAT